MSIKSPGTGGINPSSLAPSNATYITQTASSSLSNEQALGALATGILKSATTTGVVSIAAAGADYVGSVANPTASIGLVAVNGSAITAMRSDGAPALDQAISPTWTGHHIFSFDSDGGPNAAVLMRGAVNNSASLAWGVLNQPVGGKYWDIIVSGTSLNFRVTDDTNSTRQTWLSCIRNLTSIASLAFGNATDNPGFVFLGTGNVQFGGTTTGAQIATFVATNKPGSGTAGPIAWAPVLTAGGTQGYIPIFGA